MRRLSELLMNLGATPQEMAQHINQNANQAAGSLPAFNQLLSIGTGIPQGVPGDDYSTFALSQALLNKEMDNPAAVDPSDGYVHLPDVGKSPLHPTWFRWSQFADPVIQDLEMGGYK